MKKIESFLKNLLLKILLNLYRAPKPKSELKLNASSKVLFIRLNRIGDALVTTPLLHAIKKKSGCIIHILADKKNHFVYTNNSDINKVIIFQKGLRGIKDYRKLINSEKYDAIVDLHDDVSTTVSFLITLSGIKHRLALKKENYKIFTGTVEKLNPSQFHVIERLLVLTNLLNININDLEPNIVYKPKMISLLEIEKFLEKTFPQKKYLIGINISAGSDARFWGVENFKRLLDSLKKFNVSIIIIAAEKDLIFAEQISENKVPIFCSPDFDKFASLISKLNFLFTPDTSIIHLASAYQIPVFGIYVKFNTEDVIWYPYRSEYDAAITLEPNFSKLNYSDVKYKFLRFFEEQYNREIN